ncbi:hypothetical protein ACFWAP_00855 [Streptomyces goshikiensis]|uniref:hypothetical protein n=1 Tax=Streptomyces goshikiensis TaxID=1942 RepID=UPI00366A3541
MTYYKDFWSEALDQVEILEWDDIDVSENVGPMGAALVEAYDKFERDELKVAAAVKAAGTQFVHYDIETFQKVVDSFQVEWESWGEAGQEYLDDHHDKFPVDWVDPNAAFWKQIQSEKEVWVEFDNRQEIWVFERLGS